MSLRRVGNYEDVAKTVERNREREERQAENRRIDTLNQGRNRRSI